MSNFTAEQLAAIETLHCNLLVKAGAGAGKTRVLVERYIRILATGAASTDGIVAITFTRKAAREMKERIRAKVDDMLTTADSEEWKRWREVANRLDTVAISTIHSLCSRILREHPAEAGVDPEFGLLEDARAKELLDEVWQETLTQAASQAASWLTRLLAVYSPVQVREEMRPLFDKVLSEGLVGPDLEQSLWPVGERADGRRAAASRLKLAYRELFDLAATAKKKTASQDRLQSLREQWPTIERIIDGADGDPDQLDELETAFRNLRGGADLGEALRERKRAAEALRGAILDRTALQLLPDLCELFRLAGAEWNRLKRVGRMLTYDDLEAETERLLLTHPEICDRYNRRIRFWLVDECQDINERQRSIIYLLAGGDPQQLTGTGLFAVGDVKQSIYRFRGADARVFGRVESDVRASGGQVIELLDNFRSQPELVSAFNDFFGELMPATVCEDDTDGADAVEYRQLQGRKQLDGHARIDLWVLDGAEGAGGDPREREAAMIARRVRELAESTERPVQYREIAVLLRAFTDVVAYEQAFARTGVPYYVAGGRGFAGRQEIADALGLLQFLDNPRNESALFGLLRSPFFLVSDEGLLLLRRAGAAEGLWAGLGLAATVPGLSAADRTAALRARPLLERWLARRGFLTPAQLLRESFAATGFDILQLTQFMGTRRYANLQKLLEMAETFMRDEPGGIADFLSYVELRAADEGEAEIDSEMGNTVRIMTIHKSKGLEFPVVIVPDLQRKFNSWSQLSVFVRGIGVGLKLPDRQGNLRESARFQRIARTDTALERAELKRLLYVALTRAEQRIILSAVAKTTKTEKTLRNASGWLDWARHLFGLSGSPRQWPAETCLGNTCLHVCLDEEPATGSAAAAKPFKNLTDLAAAVELSTDIRRNLAAISVRQTRPLLLSPSSLGEFAECPRRYFYAHVYHLPVPPDLAASTDQHREASEATASVSIAPRDLGTAFHRFMELLPSFRDWSEALQQALRDSLPPQLRQEAGALMQQWAGHYADSALYAESASVSADLREWPFNFRLLTAAGALPAVWLSGQADRVLFYPDGTLGIIDYKTDQLTTASLQQKTAHYRLQLAGYALAARAVFGLPVRDARLYFVRLGHTASIDTATPELATAEHELRELAEFLRNHTEEADYGCRLSHCPVCPFQTICLKE